MCFLSCNKKRREGKKKALLDLNPKRNETLK